MKLRFEVDQAACLRAGIDCPKSIVTLEIIPSQLTQDQRDLLADRLHGIDVCELGFAKGRPQKVYRDKLEDDIPDEKRDRPNKIKAGRPDFLGLMKAVLENEQWIRTRGRSWMEQNRQDNFAFRKHAGTKGGTLETVALSETDYSAPDDEEIRRILREPAVK